MLLLAEPPANGAYMVAAYSIVALVVGAYTLTLLRRVALAERTEMAERTEDVR
jgi:hypothetical protein